MGQNGNGTTSKPPNTGEIDEAWNQAAKKDEVADDRRPTASPPGEGYEHLARRMSSGLLSGVDAKRALSAPGLPRIGREEMPTIPDDGFIRELEGAFPVLGQQMSGAHAIPLDLSENGPQLEDPAAPTVAAPPPESFRPTRPVSASDSDLWRQEAPTPNALDKATVARVRGDDPPPSKRPIVRQGTRAPEPLIEPIEEREDSLMRQLDINEDGGALSLVSARATSPPPAKAGDPIVDLRDRYALGDFTGAHEIAEAILAEDPDHEEAKRYQQSCRDILIQMYSARLGSTTSVPRIALPPAELQWLSLDHRSGFLLSCVDGVSTIDEILDVSGMSRLDTLRILFTLLQQRVIDVTPAE